MPSGLMLGLGVRTVATEKLFSQGNLVETGNAFDVAIEGRGFIEVLMPDGSQAYTRDGSFQIDNQGQLVTSSGYVVQPAITVPEGAQSVSIGSDGTVSVVTPGSAIATQVGNVQLTDFINPAGLMPMGKNLYVETGSSGTPQAGNPGVNGLGTIMQGFIESSNVNVVEELVNMIETQRAYEINSRAISTSDQMLQFITNNT